MWAGRASPRSAGEGRGHSPQIAQKIASFRAILGRMTSLFELGASRSLLLGIAGGTGSGKTTLAAKIGEALGPGSALISHDWYYRDRTGYTPEQREAINYDEPAALDNALLCQH